MRKLLLLLSLMPALAWSQATTGFHRINQVIARANGGVTAEVVPYANVQVSNTATGALGVIYSDPLLTVPILSGTVTADGSGNYNYYFGLNTCMTERISSPGQGNITIPNVCSNGSGGCNDGYGGGGYGGCGYIIQVNGVQIKDPQIANLTNSASVVFSNPNGSTILAQVVGGGSGPVVQVNGVNLLTASPVNLINSPSITVTNPSVGQVQFTAVNPGPVIEVNSTPISPATPANFVDTTSVSWNFTGGQIKATAAITGCSTQGVAGTLNVSDGSGGCVSSPADYGATRAGTFTFAPTGSGTSGYLESSFNITTTETGLSSYGAGLNVTLQDNYASGNSYGASYNFQSNSYGADGAGYLILLDGGPGIRGANWELDTSSEVVAGNQGNDSDNMYINLTGFKNNNNANFEVSTDCGVTGSGGCNAEFSEFSDNAAGGNFTVTLSSDGSGNADSTSNNVEFDTTGAVGGGGAFSADTVAGISLNDSSSTGIAINEGSTGLIAIAANAINLTALADTDVTINSEIVCTASNGECPGGALSGGATGSLPYQSAVNTTTFIASPTTSGHAFVPMWQPSGSAIAPTAVDLGTYLGTNVTASSPIVATPSTLGTQISCPTCGTTGGGTSLGVNGGSTLGSANLNAIAPVADANYLALLPKISAANIIIEVPYGSASGKGVVEVDNTTIVASAGVISVASGAGMTWPSTPGLTVCTGTPCTAWGTSKASPSGTIVGTTDTQTLTNKTVDGVTPTVFGYIDPTSSIQTQLNGKQATIGYTPAHAGANSDITSLAGLTTPLSVPQGGTGAITLSGYLFGNGTSAFTASSTIPGSAISGNIPGASSNVYGTPTFPNGTTAVTQAANDNTQNLATTAYVKAPGNITPTGITLTGAGPSTIGLPGVTYATLQAAFPCASNQGRIASVTDSTTTTVGAVITGGGSNFVFAACKGTAWQVLL